MTAEGRAVGRAMRRAWPARRGGRTVAAERKPASWLLAAGVVTFAISAAGLGLLFVSRPELSFMIDLQVYVWGGHMARLTGTPYQGTGAPLNLSFTYPPIAAAAFELLSRIHLVVLKWLVSIASVAALAVVVWLSWGKLGYRRSRGRLGGTLLVTAVVLWLEPVQQTLALGQVNVLLMLLVVADLCLPDSNLLNGVGVGLAAAVKLTPLIFIPYLLLTRRYRAAGVAAGTFGLTIAASYLLLPKAAGQFWTGRLFLTVGRVGNAAYVGNESLYGAALRLFGSAGAARPYWLAAATLVGLAGLLLAAWLSRRGLELAGIVTCALTGLLVAPVSWSHHWVWIAPILVALTELVVRAAKVVTLSPGLLAGWLAVTVAGMTVLAALALYIAYPFHAAPGAPLLPAGLIWTVPSPAVQGSHMTGYQELIGNLYVLAGLIAVTVLAAWLLVPVLGRRALQDRSGLVAAIARLSRLRHHGRRRVSTPMTTAGSAAPPPSLPPATGGVATGGVAALSEAVTAPPPPHSPSGLEETPPQPPVRPPTRHRGR
jgi:alpha-1,2-mannosyltransferase